MGEVICNRCRKKIDGEPTVTTVLGPKRTVVHYCAGCANAAPSK